MLVFVSLFLFCIFFCFFRLLLTPKGSPPPTASIMAGFHATYLSPRGILRGSAAASSPRGKAQGAAAFDAPSPAGLLAFPATQETSDMKSDAAVYAAAPPSAPSSFPTGPAPTASSPPPAAAATVAAASLENESSQRLLPDAAAADEPPVVPVDMMAQLPECPSHPSSFPSSIGQASSGLPDSGLSSREQSFPVGSGAAPAHAALAHAPSGDVGASLSIVPEGRIERV